MNRESFLQALRQALNGMPTEEIDNAIAYYEEYFADAGEENEQAVIKELGTPAAVAAQIRADVAIRALTTQPPTAKKGISAVWLVILAVFASPIALPLAIAFFTVAIALLIVIFVLLIVFFIVSVGLFAGGIGGLALAIVAMFVDFGVGIVSFGSSLVCIGVGLLFGVLLVQCSRMGFRGLAHLLNRLTHKSKGGKRYE